MKEAEDCFLKVRNKYFTFLKKEKIYSQSKKNKIDNLRKFYIPLSFWINNKINKKKKTLFLGFSGGQGAGKTTATDILKIILSNYFKKKVQVISIDDFYKTLKDRNKMSEKIHILFKTRGVPGTHDTNLIKKFFHLINKKKFKKFKTPKFSKEIDDRLPRKSWFSINQKPDIVILEGWCVGAKTQSNSLIRRPVNNLEKYEDKSLVWRKYVNEKLKTEYKKIFIMIDHFIFMKVPDFKMVFKWRLLQEEKLKKKSNFHKKIMSYNQIKRFIMFYERITLQMIKDLSKSASVILFLKKNHEIKKIFFRK